jgi:hypothetical protein
MPAKKNRRGSTLVMVALMLVAIAGVGAIAADIGRFYVVAGELQTSADAVALAGAQTLQFSSAADPTSAVVSTTGTFVGASNRADAVTPTLDSTSLGWWEPNVNGGGAFTTPAPVGKRPNAVYVAVSTAPRGVFSQLIGQGAGLPLRRRAIAWVGNVSLNCVRPFNFPYGPFYKRVNNLASIPASPIPDLDPGAFAAFQNTSVANRTMIVLGRGEVAPPGFPDDGNWDGYNLPTAGGNVPANENTMQSQIETCGNIAVNGDAGIGKIVPNNGNGAKCNAQVKTTCAVLASIANPVNGVYNNCAPFRAGDAGCYASSTAQSPGVMIEMAWGDATQGVGVDFRYVAEFQLTCVFSDPTQTCGALTAPKNTNYPPGTIVGVALGLKSRLLSPADIISNAPGNVQRLFLVK